MILNLILFLGFIFLLVIVIIYQKMNKSLEQEIANLEKEKNELEKIGDNLTEYRESLTLLKEKGKTEILGLFEANKNISNDDVADKLKISRSSAFRYLEELQQEGKISQIGKTGRAVVYSLVRKRDT